MASRVIWMRGAFLVGDILQKRVEIQPDSSLVFVCESGMMEADENKTPQQSTLHINMLIRSFF